MPIPREFCLGDDLSDFESYSTESGDSDEMCCFCGGLGAEKRVDKFKVGGPRKYFKTDHCHEDCENN